MNLNQKTNAIERVSNICIAYQTSEFSKYRKLNISSKKPEIENYINGFKAKIDIESKKENIEPKTIMRIFFNN